MSLIMEDGTGVAGANAYISVADADAHHATRGITLWATLSTAEKEQAIIRGADYIEGVYGSRFKGLRVAFDQAMSWPRNGVQLDCYLYPSNEVPNAIVKANAEIAFRAASGELQRDVDAQHVEAVKVGPIERRMSAPRNGGQKRYAAIDALMRGLIVGGLNSVAIVRT